MRRPGSSTRSSEADDPAVGLARRRARRRHVLVQAWRCADRREVAQAVAAQVDGGQEDQPDQGGRSIRARPATISAAAAASNTGPAKIAGTEAMYGSWRSLIAGDGHGRRESDHAPQRLEVAPQGQPGAACSLTRRAAGRVARRACSLWRISSTNPIAANAGDRQLEQHQIAAGKAEAAGTRAARSVIRYENPYCPKASSSISRAKPERGPSQRRQRSKLASPGHQPHDQHQRHGADVQAELVRVVADHAAGEQVRRHQLQQVQRMQRAPDGKVRVGRQPRAVQPGVEGGKQLDSAQQQADPLGNDHARPRLRRAADAVVAGGAQIAAGPGGVLVRRSGGRSRSRDLGHQREPDVLRIAQQQLRAGQQRDQRRRPARPVAAASRPARRRSPTAATGCGRSPPRRWDGRSAAD